MMSKSGAADLDQGEAVDLNTRVDGGPVVNYDELDDDIVAFDRPYETLSEHEIRRLAELIGLEIGGE